MTATTTKVGRRGTIVIPAELRRQFGFEEGSLVIAESTDEGVLIRPAIALPVEQYTLERRAEFLLSNAIDAEEYASAVEQVRAMGLEPEMIVHYRPA
jgi:AbrB family looped-hinge helix DNA binding protein